jgi:hypothetical protein
MLIALHIDIMHMFILMLIWYLGELTVSIINIGNGIDEFINRY